MEKKPAFIDLRVRPAIDGPENKAPFPRESSAFEDDGVPQPPAVALGQLAARGGPPAVLEERELLVLRDDVLRINCEIVGHVHGKLGEKVLLVDVHPTEPVTVGHPHDAGQGLNHN